ncbi:MAG: hypothetical protein CVU88_03595 [Firmicutes bacterium HGW-Firmicutes-13]|nr:MAG: hypothetical protein CVU88_03595 [Firmicutes bacterium HGW-Firmicutes-13]
MSDYLSQEEIDRLLRKVTEDEDENENGNVSAQKLQNMTHEEGPVVEKAKFKPLTAGNSKGPRREIREYGDIILNLSVELGKTTLTVREVLNLEKDSVIKLEKMAGDNVGVLVNKRYFANGEIVVINDNFGLRITSF